MNFSLSERRKKNRRQERSKVLDYIANHAAKKDFIDWLNANYQQQFPEDADWDHLQRAVKDNAAIHATALHNYAGTLTDQSDVNKLLKDVEKETTKAEAVVSELYDASNARRLQPIVGGACILGGFLLIVASSALLSGITGFDITTELRNYLAAVGGIYGVVTIFAGILLILE